MKSEETSYLLGLYRAILDDCTFELPTLRVEFDRDWSRLCSLVEARGLRVFTLDLPDVGKHLERCLSTGTFTKVCMPGFRPYRRRGIIPRLFRGLFLRVFDELGMLRPDYDVNSIRLLRQLLIGAKKWRKECTNESIFLAVDEFFAVERAIRPPNLDWSGDRLADSRGELEEALRRISFRDLDRGRSPSHPDLFDPEETDSFSGSVEYFECIQSVCDIVSAELGVFKPHNWRTKHGPGAVADGPSGKSKYDFPCWPAKLEAVFPLADFAFANYALWADFVQTESGHERRFSAHEPPSRLLAVPKTQKGPRLIASEPIAHQWCQQSIKDYFQSRICETSVGASINFVDQRPNQEAARRASQRSGDWTIDLSSASDRVSCWFVERLFRRNVSLLEALHASRTRWIVNTIGGRNPKYHKLRKFSAMGSACTFPVETVAFVCIVIGTLLRCRGLQPTTRNIRRVSREVRVFGDDIVVPKDAGSSVVGMLSHLGFKVNPHKTFGTGKFRESCGLDVYEGVDVTPVYSMTYPRWAVPESVVSCVETAKNFHKSYLWSSADYIRSMVNKKRKLPTVPLGSGKLGFWRTNTEFPEPSRYSRWNSDLQCLQILATQATARVKRLRDRVPSMLLQYFTEEPPPTVKWVGGFALRPSTKLVRRWEIA